MAGSSSTMHLQGPAGVREVTEDTPPDLLEGTMDLLVVLPSKKTVRMTVNRRTPVMDLLVQVTTANKINPGGHIVQVRNEIGRELQYKPSTPIGALDTRTIEIVPKHQVNDYIIVKSKQSAKVSSQPFEHTFRLQVHLPKNQLYVMRVGPKVLLQDVLEEVCQEKDLDISKYEIRHPTNLDEKLSLTNRLGDYGLQQVRVVSKNSRINSSVSSADILALQQQKANGRGSQGQLDSAFNYSRSSVGESSVSSGSAASARGTSPSRSDDSRSISPIGILPSKIKLRSSVSNASSPSYSSPLQTAMLKKSISSNPLPGFPGAGSTSELCSKLKKKAPPPPPPDSHRTLTQTVPTSETAALPEVRPHFQKQKESSALTPRSSALPSTSAVGSRSRQSSASDSSGYHEASASSILSDQQQEMIRRDRAIAAARKVGTGSLSSLNHPPTAATAYGMSSGSTSTTNLTSGLSVSTTSIASSGSRNKRKAPKPPVTPTLPAPLEEEVPAPIQSQPSDEAQERKALEVQVEVHNAVSATSEHPQVAETEVPSEEPRLQSSETPKDASNTSCSTSSSISGSTLTKSVGSESVSGSKGSLVSLPPSPIPPEEIQISPLVSTSLDASPPLSPSSPVSEGDKHEESSSGSEASYADSGLPATATVTPSPVSLEPDGHENHSDKSLNSSRRSSIHSSGSDHSECWRELIDCKDDGQMTDKSPIPPVDSGNNALQSVEIQNDPIPSPVADEQQDKAISQMKVEELQEIQEPPRQLDPPNASDSSQPSSETEESVQRKQKKRDSRGSSSSSSSSTTPKLLPCKSDSFTYKGDSDGKKRRSSSMTGNAVVPRRLGTKAICYTSSSEDDDQRRGTYQEKAKNKSISMQNLSKEKSKFSYAQESSSVQTSDDIETEKMVKATSLASLPLGKDSAEALNGLGNDPKLLETFQVELELQFEQWKEQFLQRHLGTPPKSPVDAQAPVDIRQQGDSSPGTITLVRKDSSSSSSGSNGEIEQETLVDPAVPQVVHSVGSRSQDYEEPPSKSEPPAKSKPIGTSEPPSKTDTSGQAVPAEPKQTAPVEKVQEHHTNEAGMNGADEVKLREKRTPATPPVYRYSGPPAINMGTWGERPKRSPITVKEDNDYIMGMGQNEAKVTIEAKASNVASRVHGFTGVPIVNSVPKRTPSPASSRWSNIEIKSPEPTPATPVPSVLSTWKQRMEETKKVNSSDTELRSVSAMSTLERPRSNLNKPSFTISSATSTLERPVSKRTPSPLFTGAEVTPVQTPTAVAPPSSVFAAMAAIPKEAIVIEESSKVSVTANGKFTNNDGSFDASNNQRISMEDRKRFFQGTRPAAPAKDVNSRGIQLKSSSFIDTKKSKEVILEDNVDAASTSSRSTSSASSSSFGSFEASRPSSVTLEEKKRFFQGVKPCESPTREVPIPAVNLKSSIATIQRVFEQQGKAPLQKSISSMSLTSDSSKVTSPSVSATPSPYGTMNKKSDIIGINQNETDFMVSQVLKGRGTLESFHRTPSPVQPTTASETVRISTTTSLPTGSNIQNFGNKAIIVVGSQSNDPPKTTNGHFYRQQLKVNSGEEGHSVKISINGNAGEKGAKQPSTIILNGNAAPKLQASVNVKEKEIIIEETKKSAPKSKIQEMQSLLAQQKLNFQPPPTSSPLKLEKRPTTLNDSGNISRSDEVSNKTSKSSSVSSVTSSEAGSAPPTPSSPLEARAGILSAIKNSGGNFALKKTRSSVLLK